MLFSYTICGRDSTTSCISLYPHYKIYQGQKLREEDILIIAIYLSASALLGFKILMEHFRKDIKEYQDIFKKAFAVININYDADKHIKKYIFHRDLERWFERKNSKILLFNSWETEDLYSCIPIIRHYCRYHKIPFHKFILSMTDHQHMWKKYPNPRIISYDWQYIYAKKKFKRENIISTKTPKTKYIHFMNARCNEERFSTAAYLFSNYQDKCYISFLINARSQKITEKFLHMATQFLSAKQISVFRKRLPLTRDIISFIKDSYIMLVFETNIIRCGCQQISEKTYRPIIAGIPFILWTYQGGVLPHLRKLGFTTFSPFIHEEYDNPKKSYVERYRALIAELNRICSLAPKEIEQLYLDCLPMIQHNFTILEARDNIPRLL